MAESVKVCVAWHSLEQRDKFLAAWNISADDPRLQLQFDGKKEGCAVTKNKAIAAAMASGAETVVVLDDDCFPTFDLSAQRPTLTLGKLISGHLESLKQKSNCAFVNTTDPPSRGSLYYEQPTPVAASMGFWEGIPDYDAPSQLVRGRSQHSFSFKSGYVFGRYFPLCGMNLAFRPKDWLPWCQFIDVPRFDDIWMGFLWQREAYRRGYCFSLNGPTVLHARQSNVWQNLKDEAKYLEENETLWLKIHQCKLAEYTALRALLPV